jgi:DNA-binding transcriptional ArsR family regulator
MARLFKEMAGLDKLIHEPARLAIMTALSSCKRADFLFLQRLTGLTKGNLSSHLSKLEAVELIEINKQFIGKKPNTLVALTSKGRFAVDLHWKRLDNLRSQAQQWKLDEVDET